MPNVQTTPMSSSDIAKYFLMRASLDGDLITPLKMQKLVYLAYAKTLAKNNKKLFEEKIEAWPMGPVVPSLYNELKRYGSSPIPESYIGTRKDFKNVENKFSPDLKATVDEVYENYIGKSAFELVTLVHEDLAWKKARAGLKPEQPSNNTISDKDILAAYT